MHDSAFRWFIVKKVKIFWRYVKIFEFSRLWENIESWLIYANKLFWIAQPLNFWIAQLLFHAFKTFNRYNLSKLKKSNCFIYIAIAKYCWVIKLGELKSDQKYFAR